MCLSKSALAIAPAIIAVRLIAFWILVIAEWTGKQSLSLLPLAFLMYPEAVLVPHDATLTGWAAVVFSVVLCGSVFVVALLIQSLNKLPRLLRRYCR